MKTEQKVIPLFQSENLINVKIATIGDSMIDCVSSRELYLKLGHNKEKWVRWYAKNILENEWFLENRDWASLPDVASSGQRTMDFLVTVEFAKHIAMMAKTQKAHEYRNYLISCEKRLINNQFQQLEAAQEKLKNSIPLHPNSISAVIGTRDSKIAKDAYDELIDVGWVFDVPEAIIKHNYRVTLAGAEAGFYDFQKSSVRVSPKAQELLLQLLREKLDDNQEDIFT